MFDSYRLVFSVRYILSRLTLYIFCACACKRVEVIIIIANMFSQYCGGILFCIIAVSSTLENDIPKSAHKKEGN